MTKERIKKQIARNSAMIAELEASRYWRLACLKAIDKQIARLEDMRK